MKDIPFFTTDYGVASLMLAEIPYRQEAYIRVQSVHDGAVEDLIRECMAFCRAAGAEKVYWSAGEVEGELHTSIYEMRGVAWVDPAKLENLFPVTEETVTRWRQILMSSPSECRMIILLPFLMARQWSESVRRYSVREGSG